MRSPPSQVDGDNAGPEAVPPTAQRKRKQCAWTIASGGGGPAARTRARLELSRAWDDSVGAAAAEAVGVLAEARTRGYLAADIITDEVRVRTTSEEKETRKI